MAKCRVCGRSAGLFFHLCPEHRGAPGAQRPLVADAPPPRREVSAESGQLHMQVPEAAVARGAPSLQPSTSPGAMRRVFFAVVAALILLMITGGNALQDNPSKRLFFITLVATVVGGLIGVFVGKPGKGAAARFMTGSGAAVIVAMAIVALRGSPHLFLFYVGQAFIPWLVLAGCLVAVARGAFVDAQPAPGAQRPLEADAPTPPKGEVSTESGQLQITRSQLVSRIDEALGDTEKAIRVHPPETVSFYDRGRLAHEIGMAAATETAWSRSTGLSYDDLTSIHRYLFAAAFISAFWDVHSDLVRQNSAASTATLLVAGLGLDPKAVLARLVKYEDAWKSEMREHHFIPPLPYDVVERALRVPGVRLALDAAARKETDLRELQDRLTRSGVEDEMLPSALGNAQLLSWFFSLPDPNRITFADSLRLINWARYGDPGGPTR